MIWQWDHNLPQEKVKPNSGIAIIIVLLVVAALSAVALDFTAETGTEIQLAEYCRDRMIARECVRSFAGIALARIYNDGDLEKDDLGEAWYDFSDVDMRSHFPENCRVDGTVTDESGKLNVNYREGASFDNIKGLQDVIGMSDAIYARIQDQISVNSQYFRVDATADVNGAKSTLIAVARRDGKNEVKWIYWRIR